MFALDVALQLSVGTCDISHGMEWVHLLHKKLQKSAAYNPVLPPICPPSRRECQELLKGRYSTHSCCHKCKKQAQLCALVWWSSLTILRPLRFLANA
eukprot:1156693-Pelagomonas_calceolata.AAC.8